MTAISSSKIRGSLYGMLAGDCLGQPFEGKIYIANKNNRETRQCREKIVDFVLDFPESWQRNERMPKVAIYSGFSDYVRPIMLYTSNLAMTRNVIESLLECNGFSAENMIEKLTKTYITERNYRTYRITLGTIFETLTRNVSQQRDVYKIAKEQFGGKGSFGVYGAARASPIALFYAKNLTDVIETAKCQCLLTHAHPNAVMGSVLQVAAVYFALHCEKGRLQAYSFINKLVDVMKQQEPLIYKKAKQNPYNEKFAILSTLLENRCSINIAVKQLGTGSRAVNALSSAIFAFVKSLEKSDEMDLLNPIVRTIAYAIALGGNSNIVACMAGAIAGAYFGDNFVPRTWLNSFEGSDKMCQYSTMLCKKLNVDCWRKLDNNDVSLASFRGCLIGALAGDCFGKIFDGKVNFSNENEAQIFRTVVGKFLKNFPNGGERESLPYTFVTIIRNVAESLISCDKFNPSDMAQKFAETYLNGDWRQLYRNDAEALFSKLKETNYEDPYGPAKDLYSGYSSYSNSSWAALRSAPVALFHATNVNRALETAKLQCLLTDVHPDAVMGAVCQTASIHIALNAELCSLDKINFISRLRDIISKEELKLYPNQNYPQRNPFEKKLKDCESLLYHQSSSIVASRTFGNGNEAVNLVPAAIFAFVRCLSPSEANSDIENPLIRTLAYAITLGSNSRAVACMAGAIAGAYYGDSFIPKSWLNSLEGAAELMRYAIILQEKLLT